MATNLIFIIKQKHQQVVSGRSVGGYLYKDCRARKCRLNIHDDYITDVVKEPIKQRLEPPFLQQMEPARQRYC